ncbi:MAG: hypothetical protein ACRECY_07245 [Phyllobacterium sp.]
MGTLIPLKIALSDTAPHKAVFSSGLKLSGYDVTLDPLAPGEMYSRAFEDETLDAAEMSIARYVRMKAKGEGDLIAIPYYFSRVFPHPTFYVRSDSPFQNPSQIAGCTIGLSEYDHTGHAWARALLEDEYSISPSAVKWIVAKRESSKPPIRHFFEPPSNVALKNASPEQDLSTMLLDGEIDVLINPHKPGCFVEHPDKVRRLIANHEAVERDYFEKTNICPVQHVFGVRKELVRSDPDLARSLTQTLVEAIGASRQIWQPRSPDDKVPVVPLHGLGKGEEASLKAFLRQHYGQGLSGRQMTLEEFFTP